MLAGFQQNVIHSQGAILSGESLIGLKASASNLFAMCKTLGSIPSLVTKELCPQLAPGEPSSQN